MSENNSFSEIGTLATGLYDFDGVREDNLSFKKGEVITIIEMNESGWWKGANSEGKVGIFPFNYVEARNLHDEGEKQYRIVKALYDCFEVPGDDYLQFNAGDLITVLKPVNEDWAIGKIKADAEDPTSVAREGKFPLNYVEETGMKDDSAAKDDNEKYEKLEKEKLREAERLQKQRQELERQAQLLLEEEQKQAQEEAKKAEELLRQEREAKEKQRLQKLAEEQREKERLMELEKERKRQEMEIKLQQEEMEREEKEKENEKAVEMQRQKTLADDMMKTMEAALAEQEAQMKEIERQKTELERINNERKLALQKLQEEAEEAKRRAAKAEEELQLARAEQERLRKIQQQIDAEKSEKVAKELKAQKLKIEEKANKSYMKFTDDDGFSSPPALPDEEDVDKNTRSQFLKRNGLMQLNFEIEESNMTRNSVEVPKSYNDNQDEEDNADRKTRPFENLPKVNKASYEEVNPYPDDEYDVDVVEDHDDKKKAPVQEVKTAQEIMNLAKENFSELTQKPPTQDEVKENFNRRRNRNPVASKFANLGGKTEVCTKCGKPVGFGPQSLKALNSAWHKECFTCTTCGKVLRAGEYVDNKGKPYCNKCHKAGFGIKGFGFGGAVTGNYK